ncbi:MAG: DUF4142 domain-containing protein [Pseudomonadota bacterium]
MKALLLTLLSAAAVLAQPAAAQPSKVVPQVSQQAASPADTTTPPQPMSDRQFAMAAAASSMFERVEAQLALIQAGDRDVKAFARKMAEDHAAALEELRTAAAVAQVDLPGAVPLDAAQQAKVDALRALHGEAFDRAYLADQVEAHAHAVRLLEAYVQGGTNSSLKSWANKTLPTLREHQRLLKTLVPSAG